MGQYLIASIERIQRRAARWTEGDYRMISNVSEMLQKLQLKGVVWKVG